MEDDDWVRAPIGAPAVIVVARLEAVFDHSDLAAAWPATDYKLRLALAQSWICMEHDRDHVRSRDREDLAAALAADDQPGVDLWGEFAGWRVVRWREVLPRWGCDATRRGFIDSTQLVGADLEAVLVTDVDNSVEAGRPMEVQRFLVRHVDGACLLAGIDGVLPVPGRPPSETDRLPT